MVKIKDLLKKISGTMFLLVLFFLSSIVIAVFPDKGLIGDIVLSVVLLFMVLGGSYFYNKVNEKK